MTSKTPAVHWPLLAGVLAAAAFVSMDVMVKLINPRFDTLQVAFLRFASGSVFALLLWLTRMPRLPRRAQWGSHALRSVLLLLCLVSYFHALRLLPLAQAVAMGYLAPVFVSVLAIVVLKERPSRWLWWAIALGLCGVAVSLLPQLQQQWLQPLGATSSPRQWEGLLAAAFSAVTFSGVMVLARQQARHDALWTIVLVQNLLPCLLLAVPAAWVWRPMVMSDIAPVALLGFFATVGLLSLTWAFTHLEASRVAPLEYSGFVWAALLGYLVFGEVPTLYTLASAALIIGGCLLLLRR